jgi:hypothetical protein
MTEERRKKDGKQFVQSLEKCATANEVFGLLGSVLGPDKMQDRVKNVSDLPNVVKLKSRIAAVSALQGRDTSNQDCMDMAAQRYLEITGHTDMKQFKAEVNKYATRMSLMSHTSAQQEVQNVQESKARQVETLSI